MEHPIALWSLDDDAYYVKLISDSGRDVANWEDVNVASITNITPTDIVLPNPDRPCTRIIGEAQSTFGGLPTTAFVRSTETFSSSSKPFSISFNLYSYDTDIRYCGIGYQIGDEKPISNISGQTQQNNSNTVYYVDNHGFVNGDYVTVRGTVPDLDNYYDESGVVVKLTNDSFRLEGGIVYKLLQPGGPGGVAFKGEEVIASNDAWLGSRSDKWLFLSSTFTRNAADAKIRIRIFYYDYDDSTEKTFLINDLTIGQGANEFASISSGQTPVSLPTSIATSETHGIIAKDFLSDSNYGYYIVKNNILCSKNSSIPLVSGSSNTTLISSNSNGPSVIVPGFGFLNESGINKNYNFETFIRLNGTTTTPKRIIGPLQSTDGIYVNGPFIILKINNLIQSAYIGEWFKPMMINLQYTPESVSLWVNTEKLITISIINETISFPEKIATSGTFVGKDQDWIGFYSYDDFVSFEIDTVTIYPYVADISLLKRRFLYAQAVKTSSLENLAIQSNGNFVNFRYDVAGENKSFIFPTFSRWDNARVFDNLSVIDNALHSKTYSLPEINVGSKAYSDWLEDQEAIQNEANNFISLKPDSSYDSIHGYMYFDNEQILGESISAIYATVKKPSSSVEEQRLITIYDKFSGNYFKVSLTGTTLSYVLNYSGVDKTDVDTVIENIPMNTKISVGINLDTLRNSNDQDTANFFKSNNLVTYIGGMPNEEKTFNGRIYKLGICNKTAAEDITSYFTNGIADYAESLESTFVTYTLFPKVFINEFILDIATKSYWESSIFLSNISSYQNDILDLDFIQLNIDYPETSITLDGNFDTSSEFVKSYISFQSNVSGINETTFTSIEPLPVNKVIDAKLNWNNKKYEFTDYSLVYPPSDIDLNAYSLVIHLTIISHVITSPIEIKFMEIIGKSMPNTTAGTITSESGEKVEHYFLNNDSLEEYKENAGVFITKSSGSYLNLSNNSGVRVVELL